MLPRRREILTRVDEFLLLGIPALLFANLLLDGGDLKRVEQAIVRRARFPYVGRMPCMHGKNLAVALSPGPMHTLAPSLPNNQRCMGRADENSSLT